MIVDIAVAPDALINVAYSQLKFGSSAAERSLRDSVQAHGVLVFSSGAEISKLIATIQNSELLSSAERTRWLEFLRLLSQQHRLIADALPTDFKLTEASSESDLTALSGAGERVFVLGDHLFEKLFPLDRSGIHELPGGVSATTGGTVAEAISIDKRRKLVQIALHPSGTPRDVVWSDLFDPLAHRCRTVTVLDRYMFSEAARRDKGIRRDRPDEHIVWLLKKIAASAPIGARVRLIGGYGDEAGVPHGAEPLVELILRLWNSVPGSITELEVTVANWKQDSDLPHDRHIRFGSLGYTLTAGMDRLSSPTLWDKDGLSWSYKWDTETERTFSARELRVEQSRSASTFRKTLP